MSHEPAKYSPTGAPIYHYADGEKEWEVADGEDSLEAISTHIEQYIGKVETVFHELISDTVHIDVLFVEATTEKPFHTLITSGMSDLAMAVPSEYSASQYAELVLTLPADWEISEAAFKDETWYWPIRLLKYLARFPHKYDTWLGWGHTIPNGDPAEPYADNTQLNGMILLSSAHVPEAFEQLQATPEKTIRFLSIVPLYQAEMDLKVSQGTDALIDRFIKYGITDCLDLNRRNVAKKRFGII
jgi:Suppressor of fused protein (SUFU)